MFKKSEFSFGEKITLLLLMMFSVSLFNLAGHFLLATVMLYFLLTLKSKLLIDRASIVLFLFSVCYFVNYLIFWSLDIRSVIVYLIAPWASYLFGLNFTVYSKDKKAFEKMSVILMMGFFIHGVLNLGASIAEYGLESAFRISIDFWRGDQLSVTGCALYYVPMIGYSLSYLFFGKSAKLKIGNGFILLIAVTANSIYANRTAIYLIGILLVGATASILIQKQARARHWMIFIGVIIVLLLLWAADIGGFKSFILNLNVTQRIIGNDVGRAAVWKDYLSSDWWTHPFGGKLADFNYNFAHNLWMDVLNTAGFLPCILLIVFTFSGFSIVKRYVKFCPKQRIPYVYAVFAMTICAAAEPIIESNPYYLMILFMMLGGMQGEMKRKDIPLK